MLTKCQSDKWFLVKRLRALALFLFGKKILFYNFLADIFRVIKLFSRLLYILASKLERFSMAKLFFEVNHLRVKLILDLAALLGPAS
jgi:hypothetical protein